MTTQTGHPFSALTIPRALTRTALALSAVIALAACSSSADTSAPAPSATSAGLATLTAEEPTAAPAEPDAEPDAEPAGDVGDAVVRVNGFEFPGFEGDCSIARNAGREDVGDLSNAPSDLSVTAGIDNVAYEAETENFKNFVILGESIFKYRGTLDDSDGLGNSYDGILENMTEVGPRSPDGSREIVTVRFAGTLDEDGTPIEADVVCELQNKF